MISFYNSEVERFRSEKPGSGKDVINRFINNDPKKISWTGNLKADLSRGKLLEFGEGRITPSIYRPFTRQWLHFSRRLNERVYQMPQIFPHADAKNRLICMTGMGASASFSVLMVDEIPDYNMLEAGAQCFPLHLYENPDSANGLFEQPSGATDAHGYTRRAAITDDVLAKFRAAYGNTISKRDIFHYIYGLLHVPSYCLGFANNLSKELPHIPLATDPDHFTTLVAAGRELGDLHVGFDRVDPWPLEFANGSWDAPAGSDPATYFRVQKMKRRRHPKGTRPHDDHLQQQHHRYRHPRRRMGLRSQRQTRPQMGHGATGRIHPQRQRHRQRRQPLRHRNHRRPILSAKTARLRHPRQHGNQPHRRRAARA